MHCGLLVIVARGAKIGLFYPLHVSEVRDGLVSITVQSYRRETRHVSFADELQCAVHDDMIANTVVE